MTVRDIVIEGVETAGLSTTAEALAMRMEEAGVGFAAVATALLGGLGATGQYALAATAFAAALWATGGLPLPVTALAVPVPHGVRPGPPRK